MSFKNETVVETKSCQKCQASFDVTDKDLRFYEKVSPIFQDRKYLIPTPTLCSDCRQQRRISHRNELKYYKNSCSACDTSLISVYQDDAVFPVMCQNCWWGDDWQGSNYGADYDFSKSFFEQFAELQKRVPKISMINDNGKNSENSEYCFNFSYGKNNYLVTTAWKGEDSMYVQYGTEFKDAYDCNLLSRGENVYECISCQDVHSCYFLKNSSDCRDCFFGEDLIGCSDCFACAGLHNKQYHIFNKPYSKKEYVDYMKEFRSSGYQHFISMKDKFTELSATVPKKYSAQVGCTNSYGDNLFDCKNVLGFNLFNGENLKYYWGGSDTAKNSYDIFIGGEHELGYESITPDFTYKAVFTLYCFGGRELYYCEYCMSCENCFGCIGLKNKKYCIFNQQYSKTEYEKLVPKIIEHMRTPLLTKEGQGVVEWGEFFSSSISPFGYNETVANEYFPLSKEIAIQQGFNWSDYSPASLKVTKTISASQLPDKITDTPDDVLDWAIECEITKKPFVLTPQELDFYRRSSLSIPRRHPEQRHLDRMALRNPRKLFKRDCDKCGIVMQTTYAPERRETIYCEGCYNSEIY